MNIFREEIIDEIKKLGEIDKIASRKRKWENGIIDEIQFEELKYPPNFLPYRIKKIKGITRHCETILLLNSTCQYLYLGCKACSNKKNRIMQKYFAERRITLQIPWG